RRQILVEWNESNLSVPKQVLLHQLFEKQVSEGPERIAIRHESSSVTYGELNRKANQIANYLRSQGLRHRSLVSVCLSRRPDLVATLMGIMKAGCAYVPLDPEYPLERLRQMMEVSNASVLITEANVAGQLPQEKARTIQIDRDWADISRCSADNLPISVKDSDLAYVMFTSGSTGGAKPIAIEHNNPVAFIHWAKNQFTPEELAGVFASTSICFDLSVFEIFGPLSWGGTIVLADNPMQ